MTDNVPVNYEELLAGLAKKATKTEKPATSTINAKAGMLMYNQQPCPGNKLDVIIIASTHANLYYEDKYDPNNPTNPVCYAYSEDPDELEMKPHPKSQKPQSETCATCWANKWESDPEGGRGKACKNSRRLACIPADVAPEDVPTAEVASLTLPVTTVNKNWSPYVHKLATLYNRPPLALKTQLGVVPDAKTQFKITFDDVGAVDISVLGPVIEKSKSARELLEREYEHNPELSEEEIAEKEAKAKGKGRGRKF